MPDNGLITTPSQRPAQETIERLAAAVTVAGMTVFARIDHAAGAAEIGMPLRPATVLIFGNAKAGTTLMQARATIAIDLPLKMLVWEDAQGRAWLTHNDPHYLAQRHGVGAAVDGAIATMSAALLKLAHLAGGAD